MSRRYDRDSYTGRPRRYEREPSPKRSRRDIEREEKHTTGRSFNRDSYREYKAKETERMNDSKERSESKMGRASNPREFARSKFYLQHNDRDRGGQVHVRRETDIATRSDPNERKSDKNEKNDEKIKERKNDESASKLDSDSKLINKKPAFTERGHRRESFGRANGNLGFRGRGPFRGRGERFGGARIGDGNRRDESMRNEIVRSEKWKHDMYEKLSTRTPVNEEEQISKIEALLAS